MRGFLVVGLMALAVVLVAPASSAQAVVDTAFEQISISPFAGDPLDIGTQSYADVKFEFCYNQGGLMPPVLTEQRIKVTLSVLNAPEWGTATFVQDTYQFDIKPEDARQKTCKTPAPPPQIFLEVSRDAKGGETGTVEIQISGEAAGTLKKPEDKTATVDVGVAEASQDILSELQNASGSADEDVTSQAAEKGDSPGVGAVAVLAVGAAVLVAMRRRKE